MTVSFAYICMKRYNYEWYSETNFSQQMRYNKTGLALRSGTCILYFLTSKRSCMRVSDATIMRNQHGHVLNISIIFCENWQYNNWKLILQTRKFLSKSLSRGFICWRISSPQKGVVILGEGGWKRGKQDNGKENGRKRNVRKLYVKSYNICKVGQKWSLKRCLARYYWHFARRGKYPFGREGTTMKTPGLSHQ